MTLPTWPSLRYIRKVRRGSVFTLSTEDKSIEVYVSNGGKSMRFWDETARADNGKRGKELR